MGLAVKVIGCNANCINCYEGEIRESGQIKYNIDRIMDTLNREIGKHSKAIIHGGEPLCLKIGDLDRILGFIFDRKVRLHA